jgi:hypothetical protein
MAKSRRLKIVGEGHGLKFDATFGELKIELVGGTTRVFVPGDEKGVVVDRGFPALFPEIHVQAWIATGGELEWDGNLSKAHAALQILRNAFIRSHRGLVRVYSGGDVKGSDLAGKVKIKLVDGSLITRTVPASQVEAIDGHLWIPRWLAIKKADGKGFTGETRLPFVLESAIARIDAELARQVELLKELALPLQDAERIDAPLRAKRAEEEKEAARIKKEIEKVEFIKRRAKQDKADAKATERLANLPIHAQGVTVKGKDWEKYRGNLRSKEWAIEHATVRLSGTRAYIFEDELAQKPMFWKPLHTLEITAPTTASSTLTSVCMSPASA